MERLAEVTFGPLEDGQTRILFLLSGLGDEPQASSADRRALSDQARILAQAGVRLAAGYSSPNLWASEICVITLRSNFEGLEDNHLGPAHAFSDRHLGGLPVVCPAKHQQLYRQARTPPSRSPFNTLAASPDLLGEVRRLAFAGVQTIRLAAIEHNGGNILAVLPSIHLEAIMAHLRQPERPDDTHLISPAQVLDHLMLAEAIVDRDGLTSSERFFFPPPRQSHL